MSAKDSAFRSKRRLAVFFSPVIMAQIAATAKAERVSMSRYVEDAVLRDFKRRIKRNKLLLLRSSHDTFGRGDRN